MLNPRSVLLLLPDNDERRALLRGGCPGVKFRSCGSAKAALNLLDPTTDAFVCGTGLGLAAAGRTLESIESSGIKLILRCALNESSALELAFLSQQLSGFQVWIRRRGDVTNLAESLAELLNAQDGGPIAQVLRRVSRFLPDEPLPFVVGALVLGHRRVSVQTYADMCGSAKRSLQSTLQALHLPPPRTLLLWGQACWISWRMDQLALSSKQAAASAGFTDGVRMSAAFRRVTGHSPRALLRRDSLSVLAAFLENRAGDGRATIDREPTVDRRVTDRRKMIERRKSADRRIMSDRRSLPPQDKRPK